MYGTVICPVTIRSAHLRLYLPFLNAHGRHTCLSPHLQSINLGSPEAKPPVKQSFICQAGLQKGDVPGDLIPARGVTAGGKRV